MEVPAAVLKLSQSGQLDTSLSLPVHISQLPGNLGVTCAAAHPWFPYVAVGAAGFVAEYDLTTGTKLGTFQSKAVPMALRYTQDGSHVLVVMDDWMVVAMASGSWHAHVLLPPNPKKAAADDGEGGEAALSMLLAIAGGRQPVLFFCAVGGTSVRFVHLAPLLGRKGGGGGAEEGPGKLRLPDLKKPVPITGMAAHSAEPLLLVSTSDGLIRAYAFTQQEQCGLNPAWSLSLAEVARIGSGREELFQARPELSVAPHPFMPGACMFFTALGPIMFAWELLPGGRPPSSMVPSHGAIDLGRTILSMGLLPERRCVVVLVRDRDVGQRRVVCFLLDGQPMAIGAKLQGVRVDPSSLHTILDPGAAGAHSGSQGGKLRGEPAWSSLWSPCLSSSPFSAAGGGSGRGGHASSKSGVQYDCAVCHPATGSFLLLPKRSPKASVASGDALTRQLTLPIISAVHAHHPSSACAASFVAPHHTSIRSWLGEPDMDSGEAVYQAPRYGFYLSSSSVKGYAFSRDEVQDYAKLPPSRGSGSKRFHSPDMLVPSTKQNALLVFLEVYGSGTPQTAAAERVFTLLLDRTLGELQKNFWFLPGRCGAFVGPQDEHVAVLTMVGTSINVWQTTALVEALPPLATYTFGSEMAHAIWPGPPTHSVLAAADFGQAVTAGLPCGVLMWSRTGHTISMAAIPQPGQPVAVEDTAAAAAAAGAAGAESDVPGDGPRRWSDALVEATSPAAPRPSAPKAAGQASKPSAPTALQPSGPQLRLRHGEAVLQVAWQVLQEDRAPAFAADAAVALLTSSRVVVARGDLSPVTVLELADAAAGSALGMAATVTSLLWAGPALLYSTASGEVMCLGFDGSRYRACSLPRGYRQVALVAALPDRLLLRHRLPLSSRDSAAPAITASVRRLSLPGILARCASTAAAVGLWPGGQPGCRTWTREMVERHGVAVVDKPLLWGLASGPCADLSAALAARQWKAISGESPLPFQVAACDWQAAAREVMEEKKADAASSGAAASPTPSSGVRQRLVAVVRGALAYGQFQLAASCLHAAGVSSPQLLLAGLQGDEEEVERVLKQIEQTSSSGKGLGYAAAAVDAASMAVQLKQNLSAMGSVRRLQNWRLSHKHKQADAMMTADGHDPGSEAWAEALLDGAGAAPWTRMRMQVSGDAFHGRDGPSAAGKDAIPPLDRTEINALIGAPARSSGSRQAATSPGRVATPTGNSAPTAFAVPAAAAAGGTAGSPGAASSPSAAAAGAALAAVAEPVPAGPAPRRDDQDDSDSDWSDQEGPMPPVPLPAGKAAATPPRAPAAPRPAPAKGAAAAAAGPPAGGFDLSVLTQPARPTSPHQDWSDSESGVGEQDDSSAHRGGRRAIKVVIRSKDQAPASARTPGGALAAAAKGITLGAPSFSSRSRLSPTAAPDSDSDSDKGSMASSSVVSRPPQQPVFDFESLFSPHPSPGRSAASGLPPVPPAAAAPALTAAPPAVPQLQAPPSGALAQRRAGAAAPAAADPFAGMGLPTPSAPATAAGTKAAAGPDPFLESIGFLDPPAAPAIPPPRPAVPSPPPAPAPAPAAAADPFLASLAPPAAPLPAAAAPGADSAAGADPFDFSSIPQKDPFETLTGALKPRSKQPSPERPPPMAARAPMRPPASAAPASTAPGAGVAGGATGAAAAPVPAPPASAASAASSAAANRMRAGVQALGEGSFAKAADLFAEVVSMVKRPEERQVAVHHMAAAELMKRITPDQLQLSGRLYRFMAALHLLPLPRRLPLLATAVAANEALRNFDWCVEVLGKAGQECEAAGDAVMAANCQQRQAQVRQKGSGNAALPAGEQVQLLLELLQQAQTPDVVRSTIEGMLAV